MSEKERKERPRLNTKMIVILGILIAMEVILNRFLSINAWNIKIGFSFIPVVVAALLYGAPFGALVGGLGDFIGAILFPIGAYFPGFTLTAALMGLVWGLLLSKKQSLPRIAIAAAINQFILGLVVNTYWISVLYGSPYGPLIGTRVPQAVILFVAQVIVVFAINEVMPRIKSVMK